LINMKKEQVKEILDRVLTWPPERQADAAQVLTLMEEQDKSSLRLTDEQVAEVRRRLEDPNPKFLTLDEVRERFARRGR
jgi:predicted nucleic acid-binding protein